MWRFVWYLTVGSLDKFLKGKFYLISLHLKWFNWIWQKRRRDSVKFTSFCCDLHYNLQSRKNAINRYLSYSRRIFVWIVAHFKQVFHTEPFKIQMFEYQLTGNEQYDLRIIVFINRLLRLFLYLNADKMEIINALSYILK